MARIPPAYLGTLAVVLKLAKQMPASREPSTGNDAVPSADAQTPTDAEAKAPPDAAALVGEIFDEAAAEGDCTAAVASLRAAHATGGAEWKPERLLHLIDAATKVDDEAKAP